jgi:hypothetical protein
MNSKDNPMDRFYRQALKKWAICEKPPRDSKSRILLKAARASITSHKSTIVFISQFFQSFQSFEHLERFPSQEYAAMFFPFTQLPARLLGLRL